MTVSEQFMQDVADRLKAIGENTSEDKIRSIVDERFNLLKSDADFVRKMRFGSDEPVVGGKFARWNLTPESIEFLFDIMMANKRSGGSGPSPELEAAFKAYSDAVYMSEEEIKRIDRQAIDDLFPRVTKHNRAQWEAAHRAMDTAESGFGSQLVGAQYVGSIWAGARNESRILGLIPSFEMTAPVAYLPVLADIPEFLFVGESTANNSSNYNTTKTGSNRVAVTAYKFIAHQMWSGELEEDSIVPFVALIQEQLARSVGYYSDSIVMNGDTTNAGTGNINLDDADPADTKHYLAADGIRHAALVDNTANGDNVAGAIDLATLHGLKGLMLDPTYHYDWGHPTNGQDLIYVADPQTADAIAALDPVLNARIYNGGTNLLNGQVAAILGHPVVSSIVVPKTEADGKVSTTGGNNTKGQVVAFNRTGFVTGWRRRLKLETERVPATDQNRLVASMRMGFGRFSPTGAASGIEAAAVAYNVTI